ncbi:hypothetical protein ABZ345_07150 [Lentzea sp. NPDC005914]|uniref:hypothetical protein n=1 Tax=Lentzea sp. NPDC005914 TaxID=3154572 RepID=UPI0033D16632
MNRSVLKTRTTRLALAMTALLGVVALPPALASPDRTADVDLVAAESNVCKDVVLVAYVQLPDKSRPTNIASVPYRVRPCGNQHPGSWVAFTSAPTMTAPGQALAFELQGIDVRLDGVGANSKTESSAHYKGVVKLTQKMANVPLLPLAPLTLRTITLAIRFTVYHQKSGGKTKGTNVKLPNFIKVDSIWSSHPDLVKFDWQKKGYVR